MTKQEALRYAEVLKNSFKYYWFNAEEQEAVLAAAQLLRDVAGAEPVAMYDPRKTPGDCWCDGFSEAPFNEIDNAQVNHGGWALLYKSPLEGG